jgi:Fibronectin type III domain
VRRKRLLLVPLLLSLLSGCGAVGLSPTPGVTPSAGATPSPGPSWILLAQGSPSSSPSSGYPSRSATPAFGFLPIGGAAPGPTATPAPKCSANIFKLTKVAGAGVTTGTTSAVVSWYNVGGGNLRQFRLTAISQDLHSGRQRDVGWVTVTPSTPCGQMSGTITGLDRKTGYVFSVDAVVQRRVGDGTYAATIARSGVVNTT